jgi:hypothetical protein
VSNADKRLWRTKKGDLVEDGHPEAEYLAYTPGDTLSDKDKGKVRAAKKAPAASNKQADAPANKQASKPADK